MDVRAHEDGSPSGRRDGLKPFEARNGSARRSIGGSRAVFEPSDAPRRIEKVTAFGSGASCCSCPRCPRWRSSTKTGRRRRKNHGEQQARFAALAEQAASRRRLASSVFEAVRAKPRGLHAFLAGRALAVGFPWGVDVWPVVARPDIPLPSPHRRRDRRAPRLVPGPSERAAHRGRASGDPRASLALEMRKAAGVVPKTSARSMTRASSARSGPRWPLRSRAKRYGVDTKGNGQRGSVNWGSRSS